MTNHQAARVMNMRPDRLQSTVSQNQLTRLEPRQPLFHEGDSSECCYLLQSGLMRLMRVKPDGRSITLRHLLPGDLFGEEAFIGSTRVADAEAASEAVVEVIDLRTAGDGEEVEQIVRSLITQTRRLVDDEYDFQVGYLRERIARYLCKLLKTPLATRESNGAWCVNASHELIAEGTASTRESVSKELAEMRFDGIIETRYRCIEISDLRSLRLLGDPEEALIG